MQISESMPVISREKKIKTGFLVFRGAQFEVLHNYSSQAPESTDEKTRVPGGDSPSLMSGQKAGLGPMASCLYLQRNAAVTWKPHDS